MTGAPRAAGARSRRSRRARVVYLDSSALVKVIVAEAETDALLAYLRSHPVQVTSRIATVEVARAVARQGAVDPARASAVLEQVTLIEVDAEVADRAGALAPVSLRSLDAIHLATAIGLRRELDAVITYDARLAAGADLHGLRVATPGLPRQSTETGRSGPLERLRGH